MISVVDTSTRLSKKPLRRMPASTPATRPMIVSKRTATSVSLIVTGSRWAMMSSTGRPWKSLPRSPVGQVAEVLRVLDHERVVEVVVRPELRRDGGGERAVAGQGPDGVAGQRVDHGEDQERRAEQHWDGQQQAADDEAAHDPPSFIGWVSRRRDGSHHAPTSGRSVRPWRPRAARVAGRGRAPGRTCSWCGRYAPASVVRCRALLDGDRRDVDATEDVDLDVVDLVRPDRLLGPKNIGMTGMSSSRMSSACW